MKKTKLILVLLLVFVIGCDGFSNLNLEDLSDEDLQRISEKLIVCNEPYIRFSSGCCLDTNNNSICDKDDIEEEIIEETEEETNQEHTVNYKSIKNEISINETAEFEIIIKNNNDFTDKFSFEFTSNKWSYSFKPNYVGEIEIPANSEKKISLFAYPNEIDTGEHNINLIVKSSKTKINKAISLIVNIN